MNLTGSIRARGTTADVWFDYGTDAFSFPNSILASEMTVQGDLEMPVNVDLTNLDRTLIYYYRVRAESGDGGTGFGETKQLQIGALLGLEQTFPRAVRYDESSGEVMVNLLPPKLGGWRFEGETKWRPSGVPVTGLTTSQREVIFQPVAGYIQPRQETIGVVSGEPSVVLDRTCPKARLCPMPTSAKSAAGQVSLAALWSSHES